MEELTEKHGGEKGFSSTTLKLRACLVGLNKPALIGGTCRSPASYYILAQPI